VFFCGAFYDLKIPKHQFVSRKMLAFFARWKPKWRSAIDLKVIAVENACGS